MSGCDMRDNTQCIIRVTIENFRREKGRKKCVQKNRDRGIQDKQGGLTLKR